MTSRAGRFFIGLVLGLALVTWVGSVVVERTTRSWFERDTTLRAHLAANGARQALVARWRADEARELEHLLADLTRDERIMAAAACGADSTLLAATPAFPSEFSCSVVGTRVRPADDVSGSGWSAWTDVAALPGGRAQVDAVPMISGGRAVGFLVLAHDLSFIERREATTQRFLIGAFALLALAAAGVTMVAARLSWRDWSNEIRRFLRGGTDRPEFQPILRDVRELVDRIIDEKQAEQEGGVWTAQRLKQTLSRHLHGEKVVIVANREPYIHERARDGQVAVLHPASGLVTALEPGDAGVFGCVGRPRRGLGGSGDRGPGRAAPRAPRRRGLPPSARVAEPRGGEGLLLRVLERRPLASLPPRGRAPDLPQPGLEALRGSQPQVRRRRLRRSGIPSSTATTSWIPSIASWRPGSSGTGTPSSSKDAPPWSALIRSLSNGPYGGCRTCPRRRSAGPPFARSWAWARTRSWEWGSTVSTTRRESKSA